MNQITLMTVPEYIMKFLGNDDFLKIAGVTDLILDEELMSVEFNFRKNASNVDHCKISMAEAFSYYNMEFWNKKESENYQKHESIYVQDLANTFQKVTGLKTGIRFTTVPEIILKQLGGREFLMSAGVKRLEMIPAKNGDHDPLLSIWFTPKKGPNLLRVYFRVNNTYSMIFFSQAIEESSDKMLNPGEKLFDGVYGNMLRKIFQEVTGIHSYLERISEAEAMLELLGGKEFILMTGAHNIVMNHEAKEPSLSLDLGSGLSKYNHLDMYLRENDTYSMVFSPKKEKSVSPEHTAPETESLILDNIPFMMVRKQFEDTTGLRTHLPIVHRHISNYLDQSIDIQPKEKNNKSISH